jgi:hypothetical protein
LLRAGREAFSMRLAAMLLEAGIEFLDASCAAPKVLDAV